MTLTMILIIKHTKLSSEIALIHMPITEMLSNAKKGFFIFCNLLFNFRVKLSNHKYLRSPFSINAVSPQSVAYKLLFFFMFWVYRKVKHNCDASMLQHIKQILKSAVY